MRKQIDIPDNLIENLKRAAKANNRTPKSYIEDLVIRNIAFKYNKEKEKK